MNFMAAKLPFSPAVLAGLLAMLLATGRHLPAQDWPQFLGPTRNGATTVSNLATNWGKEGPRIVWRQSVSEGFSGPVVSGGRLIQFQRVGDKEVVLCLDAATGVSQWEGNYAATYEDEMGIENGPRATPAIAGGRVFTFGADGLAAAWVLTNGAKVWQVDTKKDFGARKGFFGLAASPLIEGSLVILNVGGGNGAGVIALEAASGRLRWKATEDQASYASPIAATVTGERRVLLLTREAFVGLDPADGKVVFRRPWRPAMHASVSAATPLVVGDLAFLSAGYDKGASVLRLEKGGVTTSWENSEAMSSHYATCVHQDGFLFGFDGRADPALQHSSSFRCVELRSGKIRWSEPSLKAGTVTLVNDRLLILTERGELILAAATPEGFRPAARAQVLPFGVRAHPAVAEGRLYARSKDKLVCVDLRR